MVFSFAVSIVVGVLLTVTVFVGYGLTKPEHMQTTATWRRLDIEMGNRPPSQRKIIPLYMTTLL